MPVAIRTLADFFYVVLDAFETVTGGATCHPENGQWCYRVSDGMGIINPVLSPNTVCGSSPFQRSMKAR